MSTPRTVLVVLILLLGLLVSTCLADEVILKNGRSFRGQIVSEDDQQVVIKSGGLEIPFQRSKIKKIIRTKSPPKTKPAPDATPPPKDTKPQALPHADKTLLLFGYSGVSERTVQHAARDLESVLGLRVEILNIAPRIDRQDSRRHNRAFLFMLARSLEVEPMEDLEALARKLSAILVQSQDPDAQEMAKELENPRTQHKDSSVLRQIHQLTQRRLAEPGVVGAVAITDQDLYSEKTNFLFGTANRTARVAVVSCCRFEPENARKLRDRLKKQLLSSTGFVLGADRCKTSRCARAYPNSLQEHDAKPGTLCRVCEDRINRLLSR